MQISPSDVKFFLKYIFGRIDKSLWLDGSEGTPFGHPFGKIVTSSPLPTFNLLKLALALKNVFCLILPEDAVFNTTCMQYHFVETNLRGLVYFRYNKTEYLYFFDEIIFSYFKHQILQENKENYQLTNS